MKEYHVNLIDGIRPIDEQGLPAEPKIPTKSHKIGRFFFRLSIVILVIVIFFSANTIFPSQGMLSNFGRLSFWEGVARLALGRDKILKGELDDRINFLVLGIGGANHEGPYLTDTIILASFKPSTKEVALFSIPRDLYVPTSEFGWQKINAINSLGMIRSNDGAALTSQTISKLFDVPIHYWVRLDFSAFKKFVDLVGGVEVNVERSFVDYQYPAPNYQFQVVSFEAGPQLMDGEKALQFSRSRHGTNDESTDFARMKRQQKIILALKKKTQEDKVLTSPSKLWELYNIFREKVTTNLDFAEMARLAKIGQQIKEEQIKTYTFEAGPDGLLYSETAITGAFILRPKTNNFDEMAKVVKNAFSNKGTALGQSQNAPNALNSPTAHKPTLIILNGTPITGLAQQTKTKLEALGYQVLKTGNAPRRDYQINLLYYSDQATSKNPNVLGKELDAEAIPVPTELKNLLTPMADYLVILGTRQ